MVSNSSFNFPSGDAFKKVILGFCFFISFHPLKERFKLCEEDGLLNAHSTGCSCSLLLQYVSFFMLRSTPANTISVHPVMCARWDIG